MFGLSLERRIFDKILYDVDSSDIPPIITTVSFITLLVNWYNNRLLPLTSLLSFSTTTTTTWW
jgi:hypothetical protein